MKSKFKTSASALILFGALWVGVASSVFAFRCPFVPRDMYRHYAIEVLTLEKITLETFQFDLSRLYGSK